MSQNQFLLLPLGSVCSVPVLLWMKMCRIDRVGSVWSRNPTAPLQADEAYDEKYVINHIVPHYKFMSKYGCLSNHLEQSESGTDENELKTNNKQRLKDARDQIATDFRKSTTSTHVKSTNTLNKYTCNSNTFKPKMDARTIDNLEAIDSSPETTKLIRRWKDIVKSGIYRMTEGKWNKCHQPKFLRSERKVIEKRLQQFINGREQGDLRHQICP